MMIDRDLLKQHINNLISKNVLSEEVVNDLEAVLLVIDQDPVRPELDRFDDVFHCPVCGSPLDCDQGDFCPGCGRRLDWDGV